MGSASGAFSEWAFGRAAPASETGPDAGDFDAARTGDRREKPIQREEPTPDWNCVCETTYCDCVNDCGTPYAACLAANMAFTAATLGVATLVDGGGPQKLDNVLSSWSLHKERR